MAAQLVRKSLKVFFTAQFGIEPPMIDDVITVRTAAPGAKERRQIFGTDPQIVQIPNQRLRIRELEMPEHLQAIGGSWRRRAGGVCHGSAARGRDDERIDEFV